MQKRILSEHSPDKGRSPPTWLDLETIADVEVTSEHPNYPIEAALLEGYTQGWRAGSPGRQIIRLLFRHPQQMHCIRLEFIECAHQRTQEYALRLSQDNGASFQEVVRQQWNFSPDGSTTESETYDAKKKDVSQLELIITPDLHNDQAIASLEKLQIA